MNDKTADADRIMAGWQETIREVEANKDGFVEIPRKRIVTTPTQAMTEITQADRDAAEEHFDLWYPNTAWGYEPLVEAFACHRQRAAAEERAKIVAWLRSRDQLEDCYSELQEDWLSNRIEAREHETFTHPDNV